MSLDSENTPLTAKETAEWLGISMWTLARWRREKTICAPIKYSSRNYRWRLEDLVRWEEDRKDG